MSSPVDEDQGIGEWHVAHSDDGELIDLSFDHVSLDGVETFEVGLPPDDARALAAALIEFADDFEEPQ